MQFSLFLLTTGFLVIRTIAGDVEEIREKRGIMGPPGAGLYGAGTDPDSPDNSYYGPPSPYAGGPMSPYLALKPFLPAKPKPFASPFVDPNYFIAQKAKMLGGMFPPQAMVEDPSTLEKRQAPLDPSQKELLDSFGGIPPQQMIMPPDFWMYPTPAPKPTIVPPGYWSPFGPGSAPPVGGPGIVDPSVFISKKTKFLNDLFAAKASSTPAPPLDPADIYSAKVDEFLAKLREALNVTTPPKLDKREVGATTEPADGVDPKDKVLSSILDELSNIKNSMLTTASEIIKQQQTVAAASPASKIPKKPLPPPGSIGAYWAAKGAAAAAAADPLAPYQKRLETLGQVFDMLTQLEKDLTSALQVPPTTTAAPTTPAQPQVNITALVEALNKAQQTQFGAGPLVLGPAYPNPGYSAAYIPAMRRRRSSNSGYYARDYPGQQQQNYPGQGFQQQRQKQQENFQDRGSQGQNADFNSKILEFIVDQLGQSRHHHH